MTISPTAEDLTAEEQRNLARVEQWVNDYNEDGARAILDNCTEDLVIVVPGYLTERGSQTAAAIEGATHEQIPGRYMEIFRAFPSGTSVVVHGAVHFPRPERTYMFEVSTILDFRDGKICKETTFVDVPGMAKLGLLALPPEFFAKYDIEFNDVNGVLG